MLLFFIHVYENTRNYFVKILTTNVQFGMILHRTINIISLR